MQATTLSTPERRAHTRTPVDLWVEECHSDAIYYQRATDISLDGLFLTRTLPHPPGTRVHLKVHFDDGGSNVELDAEVVSDRRGLGMGMRFVDINLPNRARIADYLIARRSRIFSNIA
jgi:PilZ domain